MKIYWSFSMQKWIPLQLALVLASAAACAAQAPATSPQPRGTVAHRTTAAKSYSPVLVEEGKALFRQDCSFCHGRNATGGEGGPDLTRSKLVTADVGGDKIGVVVRNGRADKGMPQFDLSPQQIAGLTAFIHTQQNTMASMKGGRKGVDESDFRTGSVEAGKQYFEGAGGCASCHSASGDLAGLASRRKGLELEEQMLYPKHAKSKVSVTLASGETISGTLEYLDEFTVGLFDSTEAYRSFRIGDVKYKVDAPVEAHADLLSKYSDDDIHNLMAYLQTLR
jgi:cytochrome c oxidase cbb3-type subunit 3